ncbi:MAG: 30S ribosome-binding factor RbfA [Firmicutes bacterium]|nr:30S ribosome-binding factor RbfA [Bacillota bacterium]MBR1992856.1 30S ribosome-binding factor RbfA [Bacillota bacterium]MBR2620307.1 30S ribosome-binding factor RbfA [Bacillota bacterium]MBR3787027.1 30S ribosome-binding factor RbfA [Bacillota bacterium]
MAKGHRQGRMGEEIRKIISDLLFKGLKDPRLSAMISITAVEVTSDGSYATVYLSVLGMNSDPEKAAAQQQDTLDALNSAKGFIRKEIGRQIKLRHVPDLIFKIDKSLEYGRHIDELISTLDIRHDEEEDEE